jgi:putative transcriptional regulator
MIMNTKKRDLFDEISEGFEALEQERQSKLTLRRHAVERRPVEALSSIELVATREKLKMSQGVFAHYLRVPVRTLQNWEQGRGQPNDQAALLIRMVDQYPDTLERLEEIR